jgi:antitoxin MazE
MRLRTNRRRNSLAYSLQVPVQDMLGISQPEAHMSRALIGRWGKNLAIRFPADIAKAAGLGDGQRVEIVSSADAIVIRKLAPELTAEAMFAGKSPQAWRALYRGVYDWGPDQGRERIEE